MAAVKFVWTSGVTLFAIILLIGLLTISEQLSIEERANDDGLCQTTKTYKDEPVLYNLFGTLDDPCWDIHNIPGLENDQDILQSTPASVPAGVLGPNMELKFYHPLEARHRSTGYKFTINKMRKSDRILLSCDAVCPFGFQTNGSISKRHPANRSECFLLTDSVRQLGMFHCFCKDKNKQLKYWKNEWLALMKNDKFKIKVQKSGTPMGPAQFDEFRSDGLKYETILATNGIKDPSLVQK